MWSCEQQVNLCPVTHHGTDDCPVDHLDFWAEHASDFLLSTRRSRVQVDVYRAWCRTGSCFLGDDHCGACCHQTDNQLCIRYGTADGFCNRDTSQWFDFTNI